jgi:hypothetical protein
VGQETRDALKQLVELLRHQNPTGDMTSIVERALRELLEREMKRRFGKSDAAGQRGTREPAAAAADKQDVPAKPAPAAKPSVEAKSAPAAERRAGSAKSRRIPQKVRREVFARDEGRCTFVSGDGHRCTERGFLEVHHHNTTFARGGEATTENLRIMCRAHNLYLAQQDYGRTFMQEKLREAAARKQPSQVPECASCRSA